MSVISTPQDLAVALAHLFALEESHCSISDWYAQAQLVSDGIRENAAVVDLVSNDIWDWLSDADVRRKNATIKAEHDLFVREAIEMLEAGNWPP